MLFDQHIYQISKRQLIECLSTAVELINPLIAGHNMRVALLSREIAKVMDLPAKEVETIYYAALLHDIGAAPMTVKEKSDLVEFDVYAPYKHCLIGYLLLKNYRPFEEIAEIIHYHHSNWDFGENKAVDCTQIPMGSFIIHLADRVDILLNAENHVLLQKDEVINEIMCKPSHIFHPDCLEALKVLSYNESFWLGIASHHLHAGIVPMDSISNSDKESMTIDELEEFTKLVSLVIDFKSRFTASHSCGVATVAKKIGQIAELSSFECSELSIAGYLHDLGKIVVPNEILEKNGKLNAEEEVYIKSHSYFTYTILSKIDALKDLAKIAAHHHEKSDGSGYPFHLTDSELDIKCKILTAADIFVALTEDRPYRDGLDENTTLKIMNDMTDKGVIDSGIMKMIVANYSELNKKRVAVQNKSYVKYKNFWKTTNSMLSSRVSA